MTNVISSMTLNYEEGNYFCTLSLYVSRESWKDYVRLQWNTGRGTLIKLKLTVLLHGNGFYKNIKIIDYSLLHDPFMHIAYSNTVYV